MILWKCIVNQINCTYVILLAIILSDSSCEHWQEICFCSLFIVSTMLASSIVTWALGFCGNTNTANSVWFFCLISDLIGIWIKESKNTKPQHSILSINRNIFSTGKWSPICCVFHWHWGLAHVTFSLWAIYSLPVFHLFFCKCKLPPIFSDLRMNYWYKLTRRVIYSK